MAAANSSLSGAFAGRARVSTALLVANLLMFGVEWMAAAAQRGGGGLSMLWGMGGAASYRLGMSAAYRIYVQHQRDRLITSMFLDCWLSYLAFDILGLMRPCASRRAIYPSLADW